MRRRRGACWAAWAALACGLLAMAPGPVASAQPGGKVFLYASPKDYTRVYTFLSEAWQQGEADYVEWVNLRGGVGGYRIELLSGDHANEPQRAIELYERYRRQGAMVFNFWSSPAAFSVLPRVLKEQVVLLTPLHGRADSADGRTFPWVFPVGATYWSQAAGILDYVYRQENENLRGKRVAYVFIDTPYGREPIPVLERLRDRLGFELGLFPYTAPGNEQSGTWTQVRRFRPDWTLIWGGGVSNVVSLTEAVRNGIPLKRVFANWGLGEQDVGTAGASRVVGVRRSVTVATGREPKVIQGILQEVYPAGRGHGDPGVVGNVQHYNVGVAAASVVVEALRLALERFGEPLTPEKVRSALESIRQFDAGGLIAPVNITPEDHEGGGAIRIEEWDGTRFVPLTGWYVTRFRDVVLEVVRQQAATFRP